jgi:hypothetical protein
VLLDECAGEGQRQAWRQRSAMTAPIEPESAPKSGVHPGLSGDTVSDCAAEMSGGDASTRSITVRQRSVQFR